MAEDPTNTSTNTSTSARTNTSTSANDNENAGTNTPPSLGLPRKRLPDLAGEWPYLPPPSQNPRWPNWLDGAVPEPYRSWLREYTLDGAIPLTCSVRKCGNIASYRCLQFCGLLCHTCYADHAKSKFTKKHRCEPLLDDLIVSANQVDSTCPKHANAPLTYYCSLIKLEPFQCLECAKENQAAGVTKDLLTFEEGCKSLVSKLGVLEHTTLARIKEIEKAREEIAHARTKAYEDMDEVQSKAKQHFTALRDTITELETEYQEKIVNHFTSVFLDIKAQNDDLVEYHSQLANGLQIGIDAVGSFLTHRSLSRLPVARDYLESNLQREAPKFRDPSRLFQEPLPTFLTSEQVSMQYKSLEFDVQFFRTENTILQRRLDEERQTVYRLQNALQVKEEDLQNIRHSFDQFIIATGVKSNSQTSSAKNRQTTPQIHNHPSLKTPSMSTATQSLATFTSSSLQSSKDSAIPELADSAFYKTPRDGYQGLWAEDSRPFVTAMAVHPGTGDIFVGDTANARIKVFSKAFVLKRTILKRESGRGEISSVGALAFSADGGTLAVLDRVGNRLVLVNASGEPIRTIGRAGAGQAEFNLPRALAFDAANNIYVADTLNQRVHKYTSEGEFVQFIGEPASAHPVGRVDALGVGARGEILTMATATGGDCVCVYAPDGRFLRQIPVHRTAEGSAVLVCDTKGGFAIADTHLARVLLYTESGSVASTSEVASLCGAAFGPSGRLCVATLHGHSVREL